MSRKLRISRELAAIPPGGAREEMRRAQWSAPGGTCPRCGRKHDSSAPDDGHGPTCQWKAIIDAPAGGSVEFTRATPIDPALVGCFTCFWWRHCKRFSALEEELAKHGDQYHGAPGGVVPPEASNVKRLMAGHALVAEGCDEWKVRTE